MQIDLANRRKAEKVGNHRICQLTRTRACTGFDRGFAAGEAIRMQCVKWQT